MVSMRKEIYMFSSHYRFNPFPTAHSMSELAPLALAVEAFRRAAKGVWIPHIWIKDPDPSKWASAIAEAEEFEEAGELWLDLITFGKPASDAVVLADRITLQGGDDLRGYYHSSGDQWILLLADDGGEYRVYVCRPEAEPRFGESEEKQIISFVLFDAPSPS